jgi:hypothetical protein
MEQECEDHFVKNTIRLPDGRFQVKWPFIASPTLLGDSYKAALSRWMSMERKLLADHHLAADYHEQLDDYLKRNQLEPIPASEMNKRPHSSTTTKMRIVFDASAKTSPGKSINALLAPGPVIQAPLFNQLLNFAVAAESAESSRHDCRHRPNVPPGTRGSRGARPGPYYVAQGPQGTHTVLPTHLDSFRIC